MSFNNCVSQLANEVMLMRPAEFGIKAVFEVIKFVLKISLIQSCLRMPLERGGPSV